MKNVIKDSHISETIQLIVSLLLYIFILPNPSFTLLLGILLKTDLIISVSCLDTPSGPHTLENNSFRMVWEDVFRISLLTSWVIFLDCLTKH